MTTSLTYSFSVTLSDIVREAMLNVGAIGEAEVPTAQEFTDCQRKLNMMVKQWMGKQDFAPGLKMWTRQRGDLFLSSTRFQYSIGPSGDNWAGGIAIAQPNGANYFQNQLIAVTAGGSGVLSFGVGDVGSYTAGDYIVVQLASGDIYSSTVQTVNVGAGTVTMVGTIPAATSAAVGAYAWNYTTKAQRPLDIVTCLLRDTTWNDTPMNIMTLQDYEFLPNKAMPTYLSDPTAIYYESQIGTAGPATANGTLYIDVGGAQDVTKLLHMVYLRPVQDFNNPGDNPEYPQQWYRALCWGLSREICGMFDAIWTQDMTQNWTEALMMAREGDSDITSLYYQPKGDE